MLSKLSIKDFKCFQDVEIELSRINLFSGTNSSGKSSAIQALLLLENASMNPNSQLNSEWLNLGTFEEIRNFITRADSFKIKINNDKGDEASFTFNEDSKVGFPKITFGMLFKKIFYLSAHRIGPENSYNKNFNSSNIIGKKGEFLIDLLLMNKTFNVDIERIIDTSSYTLDYQVNYWLEKITKVKLEIEDLGISNLISASYSFNGNKLVRPYHIGSGISYLIGIIILGLYLEKDSVLIIENPEIHLHPKAQSDLADFICFIANAGIQVIVESHSDHIFNGIRKSVFRKTINNNDVKIHFFTMNENNLSENHLIKLSENGKILDYQEGLFDQFDNDLDEFLGL